MFHSYTPWKHQKPKLFWLVQGGGVIEKEQWAKMGYKYLQMKLFLNKAASYDLKLELLWKYFQINPSDWGQLASVTVSLF